jgi:hypothetical protein
MPLQSSSPILVSRAITRTHLTIGMHQSVFQGWPPTSGNESDFSSFPLVLKAVSCFDALCFYPFA